MHRLSATDQVCHRKYKSSQVLVSGQVTYPCPLYVYIGSCYLMILKDDRISYPILCQFDIRIHLRTYTQREGREKGEGRKEGEIVRL